MIIARWWDDADPKDGFAVFGFRRRRNHTDCFDPARRALRFGVCRRVLSQVQDAEDAFQATFLVLARKASVLSWHERVDGWLYATAYRIALKAKTKAKFWLVKESDDGWTIIYNPKGIDKAKKK